MLWVEGPSDAIYLRHWFLLLSSASDLTEGLDYVFAFHAGALLTHAAGEREPETITVFGEINPNYFLVLDRDPDEEETFSHRYTGNWAGHDNVWITAPKEIEGYVSDEGLSLAVGDEIKKSRISDTSRSLRERLEALSLPKSWSNRKVDLARRVVALPNNNDVVHPSHRSDLLANLERIVAFLRRCRADDVAQEGNV